MITKKVLVTGANKGIGFGIAKHLGMDGWEIVVGARNKERAEQAISKLKAENIKVAGWVNIELGDLDGLKKAADIISKEYPDLNMLINNAGIPGNMAEASFEANLNDIKETIDINFIGTFQLTKLLIPVIQKNHGRIVNITVPSEASPYWHPLAYVASKAAQNAMTSIMAMDFADKNIPIEIYDVHPGPTTTDLNGNMTGEGFHTTDLIGEKVAELVADGKNHNGEFIELYPIVKE